MSNDSNSLSGGIAIVPTLFLIFLVLKLTHQINWSWWWVTSPLWIGAGFSAIVLSIFFVSIWWRDNY